MNRPSLISNQSIVLALVVLALASALPRSLLGHQPQQGYKVSSDPAAAPIKVKAMVEAINQRARELGLVTAPDDEEQAAFVRRRRDAQLTEDFEKLHSINAEKIAAQLSAPALDHKLLSDVTADLKSRATRIKYNVPVLQVVDKGEKIRYDENPDQLASMVPELSRLIDSFLSSPVFRLSSPNDAALRLKASRDLEGVIKLSDTINKIVKRSTKIAVSR
jgi:hypothetical protein